MTKLKNVSKLHQSSVVANSLMNRGRGFLGKNSYEKELSFDISDFLKQKLARQKNVRWLDICCGSGKALIEAAEIFADKNLEIIGIDLVGMFDKIPQNQKNLQFVETSFEDYETSSKFDLITCVHGLHYIGDKLEFITKSVSWLKTDGIFLANLDPANFKSETGTPLGRKVVKDLRNYGLEYVSKKHLLICKGNKTINLNFKYLGANDNAGANYTKQNVVDSYYLF